MLGHIVAQLNVKPFDYVAIVYALQVFVRFQCEHLRLAISLAYVVLTLHAFTKFESAKRVELDSISEWTLPYTMCSI